MGKITNANYQTKHEFMDHCLYLPLFVVSVNSINVQIINNKVYAE